MNRYQVMYFEKEALRLYCWYISNDPAEPQIYSFFGLYPMTSAVISGEIGCWELHDFQTPNDPHSHGSWDKRMNPYLLRHRMIPNEASVGHSGITWPAAAWFLDPDGCFIGNCAMSK